MQTHIVNRFRFELAVDDEPLAFQVRKTFDESLQPNITQALERVFDQWVFPHERIKIDRLEINLGELPLDETDNWLGLLENKLEQALRAQLSGKNTQMLQDEKIYSDVESLLFFLKTGSLPWWELPGEFQPNDCLLRIVRSQPTLLLEALRTAPVTAVIAQRLVYQFDPEVLITFFEAVMTLEITSQELAPLVESERIYSLFSGIPVAFFSTTELIFILKKLLRKEFESVIAFLISKKALLEQRSAEPPAVEAWTGSLSLVGEEAFLEDTFNWTDFPAAPSRNMETPERYYLKHAGLVIAAPFLPAFFKALGFLDGSDFKNKEAVYQGIFILYFLATGAQTTPEFNLTLEKLLCGLTIEEPIPAMVGLSPTWLEEAEVLLESVISHWQALKRTSNRGFREAFLQRDGTLERQPDGAWLLRIERKTHDVLLETIPWGFSIIKLPWTEVLIHVEW